MPLEALAQLPNVWSLASPGFALHLFEGRLTVADMDHLEDIGERWRKKNPGRLVELVVLYPSAARMDEDERKRLVRLIARREQDRVASATVVLAEGMTGAMHRSVLTGLTLMRRPPHPMKVFARVSEAAVWLAPYYARVTPQPERLDLGAVVDEACERFDTRADQATSR